MLNQNANQPIQHQQTNNMEKVEKTNNHKAHCLILPYPIQGHINPMLQFAKRLNHKGIHITLAVPKNLSKTIQFSSNIIELQIISDGFDDHVGSPLEIEPKLYLEKFQEVGSRTLKESLAFLADSGRPVDCIIYDPFLTWGLDVAKSLGLFGAPFFTQSCAVDHIYHQVYTGELKVPVENENEIVIAGLPTLKIQDLPSFVGVYGSYPPLFEMVVAQFSNIDKADWVFFNTFDKLEQELIEHMSKTSPVKAIGPTIPSMYLDKRLPDDKEYGLNVFKPKTDTCMDWLNQRQPKSVVYVSFGSLAKLDNKQMEELAWGIKLSNHHFLWVVRALEESKLPKNFAEETSDKGLIVSWCPQLDVLAHEAVGCFITHCGWNSTLEALSLGVPMVGVPQWTDQSTNAKFVMDVWKMGIRAETDGMGLVKRETFESCIKEVMEGERGEEMKRNANKWMELSREAMSESGSSDKNIEEFVSSLVAGSKKTDQVC